MKKIVVFIPIFNGADKIFSVLSNIPTEFSKKSIFLIIDNCSQDDSVKEILKWVNKNPSQKTIILRTKKNVGYAGSQKLAYRLVTRFSLGDWVIMLHGDGQYDPSLLNNYIPYLDSSSRAVYGVRSKSVFKRVEETPLITWAAIKVLNIIESFFTGIYIKEWHSGFIMYSVKYLDLINFDEITNTPHIDGQLLGIAQNKGVTLPNFPIYKKYDGYTSFVGLPRLLYVISVFRLMPKIKKTYLSVGESEGINKSYNLSKFQIVKLHDNVGVPL